MIFLDALETIVIFIPNTETFIKYFRFYLHDKGPGKPVQHFIQHAIFVMLDEMLDWFASPQNLGKKNEDFKKEGNIGKLCWMKSWAGLPGS